MKIEGDYLIFDDGKHLTANGGKVGIDTSFNLTGGWDDALDTMDELTTAHKCELADYMIELWGKFKDGF